MSFCFIGGNTEYGLAVYLQGRRAIKFNRNLPALKNSYIVFVLNVFSLEY